ncbi:TPA: RnfH family protein [Neisseria meningitidis]|uniref:RnfH family protein n=1 Tax=Neisseria sp. SLRRB23 TaxID=3435199 RepID=UPI0030A2A31E
MLEIEIVYGLPDRQVLKTMQLAEGTTVRAAALQSGLDGIFEDLNLHSAPLGIFGKAVKDDTLLRDGDRIEVYRPLLIDPKEARRKRVQNQEE